MGLKMIYLAALVLVITFITVTGAGAQGVPTEDFPSATGEIGSGYSLFFFKMTIMAPSYLSGNSDFNPGPDENLYLQPATTENNASPDENLSFQPATTENNASPDENLPIQPAPAEDNAGPVVTGSPGVPSGTPSNVQPAPAEDNAGPVVTGSPGAPLRMPSINPSWILIAGLAIDAIIAIVILYLAVKKKI